VCLLCVDPKFWAGIQFFGELSTGSAFSHKPATKMSLNQDSNFFCRSFFPKEKRDYSVGQEKWTLLFKKKINKSTNTEEILFRHKNFKG